MEIEQNNRNELRSRQKAAFNNGVKHELFMPDLILFDLIPLYFNTK